MIVMKIDTITGDCTTATHKGWITLGSFGLGVEREFAESAKAGTADINLGLGELQNATCSKSLDRASMDLFYNSIGGTSLGEVIIDFVEVGGAGSENVTYLSYKLTNAIVSAWDISGSEDDRPEENFTLWYAKLQCQYMYTPDGKKFTTQSARGWDRVGNKEDSPADWLKPPK